jgi:DNA-binding NarL/FixJ family response regulator
LNTAAPTILIADDHPLFREALKGAVARLLPQARLLEADSEACGAGAFASRCGPFAWICCGARGHSTLVTCAPAAVAGRGVGARSQRDATRADHGAAFHSQITDSVTSARHCHGAGGRRGLESAGQPAVWKSAGGERLRDLTPQQFRVLAMVSTGLLNKQIAYSSMSEATVKAHMTAVMPSWA